MSCRKDGNAKRTRGRDLVESRGNRRAWVVALSFFVLAASTGAAYRFAVAYGWTGGLDLVNIRHAHSHVMYFGWVTPLLFALLGRGLVRDLKVRAIAMPRDRLRWILIGTFIFAAVAYPLFMAFGYRPVAIGDARIPLAVIGSTLNMVAWYGFVVWYFRRSRHLPNTHARTLGNASVGFLVLSTFGAGGLALLKPLGIDSDVWSVALTHIFLDLFSEGWFVLGILAVMHRLLRTDESEGARWSAWMLVSGIPLTFALGMQSFLVPAGLEILARVGGVLVGVGLLGEVGLLWSETSAAEHRLWRLPLALLALKAGAQLIGSLVPGLWTADLHGLRILYLHMMLLGFVSLALVAAFTRSSYGSKRWIRNAMNGAVLIVLLTLIPLSPLWPTAWSGRWTFEVAAWASAGPILVALLMLRVEVRRNAKEASEDIRNSHAQSLV